MEKYKPIFQKLKIIVRQKNIIKNILKKIGNESTSFIRMVKPKFG
jgi:hypothetical protein